MEWQGSVVSLLCRLVSCRSVARTAHEGLSKPFLLRYASPMHRNGGVAEGFSAMRTPANANATHDL